MEYIKKPFVRDSGVLFAGRMYCATAAGVLVAGRDRPSLESFDWPAPAEVVQKGLVKFRNDRFWANGGGKIMTWDPGARRWNVLLQPECDFAQFDITPEDRIVLIGCRPKPTKRGWIRHPLDLRTLEDAALLRIYDHHRRTPDKEVAYPDEVLQAALRCVDLPGFTRSWVLDGHLILYSPGYGWLYAYDAFTGHLKRIDVPWPILDGDRIDTMKKASKTKGVLDLDGMLLVENNISIYGNKYRNYLAYYDLRPARGWHDKAMARLAKNLADPFVLEELPVEGRQDVVICELDLVEYRLSEVKRVAEAEAKTIWMDERGNLVDPERYFERQKPPVAPKEEAPAPGAVGMPPGPAQAPTTKAPAVPAGAVPVQVPVAALNAMN